MTHSSQVRAGRRGWEVPESPPAGSRWRDRESQLGWRTRTYPTHESAPAALRTHLRHLELCMTTMAPSVTPIPHTLDRYPLQAHSLQSRETFHFAGCYNPQGWFAIAHALGFHDVNYVRGLRDALALLAPVGTTDAQSAPEATMAARALWWLATGGYLLDGVLPTPEAVRELVVQLAGARCHQDVVAETLDSVDQLLIQMRKGDRARRTAGANEATALAESSE